MALCRASLMSAVSMILWRGRARSGSRCSESYSIDFITCYRNVLRYSSPSSILIEPSRVGGLHHRNKWSKATRILCDLLNARRSVYRPTLFANFRWRALPRSRRCCNDPSQLCLMPWLNDLGYSRQCFGLVFCMRQIDPPVAGSSSYQ